MPRPRVSLPAVVLPAVVVPDVVAVVRRVLVVGVVPAVIVVPPVVAVVLAGVAVVALDVDVSWSMLTTVVASLKSKTDAQRQIPSLRFAFLCEGLVEGCEGLVASCEGLVEVISQAFQYMPMSHRGRQMSGDGTSSNICIQVVLPPAPVVGSFGPSREGLIGVIVSQA